MTNEEIINYGSMMPSARSAAQCACDMKDRQFKEYLEKKRNHYDIQKDSATLSNDYEEGVRCDAVVTALDIIINELFKEE